MKDVEWNELGMWAFGLVMLIMFALLGLDLVSLAVELHQQCYH